MKVKLELSSIFPFGKKESFVIDNYDEKMFPPRPKGELSYQQMFEYWSKCLKEQGVNYPPSYFDMNVNVGIIFDFKRID